MSGEDDDPRVGTVLDERYRVLERLGEGGMGVVYRAERLGLRRAVAIKFLHIHIANKKEFVERFEREAKAMSKLVHPHCVPVIDFGVADAPYLVLEFVNGPTLRDLLVHGEIERRRAIELIRQVLSGLAHAHENGIIHRDIKADNVVITTATGKAEQARLLDFGLAKLIDGTADASWSTTSIAVGTPGYMSPEQAQGKELDQRTDLYSAGVLLFELLTGRKPFQADNTLDVLRMHVEKTPPTLAEAVPERSFPPALEAIVARALAKEPSGRFATALEFADALGQKEASAEPLIIEATKPSRTRPTRIPARDDEVELARAPLPRSSWRWIGWLVLFAVVAGGGLYAWRRIEPSSPATAVDVDAAPSDAAVPGVVPEARPADAALPDAALPDAPLPDARPPDARPPDARPPDARPPDARPPDARPPDARPLDAALPDAAAGSGD